MVWSVTEIVAWWGAILSTVVFAWDVIKWRLAGPKLRLDVSSGMKSANIPEYEGKTLVLATVTNYGDRSTTLTHLTFVRYPNTWRLLRHKSQEALWVGLPNLHVSLPHELKPGQIWNGVAFEDELFSKTGTGGYLMCEVSHSHRKHPVRKRVVLK